MFGGILGSIRDGARRVWQGAATYPALALTALLTLVLALSVVLYAVYGTTRVHRVLFFPELTTGKLVGEEHYVPRVSGREQSVRVLVQELLLGPARYDLAPVLPRSVGLRSLILKDRVVYVDFTADLAIDASTVPLSLDGVVQAVANNLYFNFPRLRGVYLFVHGQVPQLAVLDATSLSYSREMVR